MGNERKLELSQQLWKLRQFRQLWQFWLNSDNPFLGTVSLGGKEWRLLCVTLCASFRCCYWYHSSFSFFVFCVCWIYFGCHSIVRIFSYLTACLRWFSVNAVHVLSAVLHRYKRTIIASCL